MSKKVKEEVESKSPKEKFVNAYVDNLARLNVKISKKVAWDIFKLGFYTAVDLGREKDKPLSLAGIAKFETLVSGRSGKVLGRVRVSSFINDAFDSKELLVNKMLEASEDGVAEVEESEKATCNVSVGVDEEL